MARKLRLIASLYDQPRKWPAERETPTDRRVQGEVFTPVSDEEYERLIAKDDSGYAPAEDPAEVQKRAEADLKARQAQLEAERAALDDQIGEVARSVPEKLSGKKLDEELSRRGLSTDGSVDEKRDRLAQAQLGENPPSA